MGGRKLREWLLNPLMDAAEIERRLEAVGEIKNDHQLRSNLRARALEAVYDLERLISRVSLGVANARDLLALKQSFTVLPRVREILLSMQFPDDLRYDRGLGRSAGGIPTDRGADLPMTLPIRFGKGS